MFSWFRRRPDLDTRVQELERAFKALSFEWEEWYDKFRRLHARLSKRDLVDARETAPRANHVRGDVPDDATGNLQLVDESQLTAEAKQVNDEILLMRRGRGL